MTKKYFILLIEYDRISLFTEINGKITNINFANGKNILSNCVRFSYDREDLEFLPEGDPFEVNNNSSFSDFLDFAGYNFDLANAQEVILESLIDNKMIPGLEKDDEIFICNQPFYYESDNVDNHVLIRDLENTRIREHNIYTYSSGPIYEASRNYLRFIFNANIIVGFPFLSYVVTWNEDISTTLFAPVMDQTVVATMNEKYPLSTRIPKPLLRNVKNRIIVSKLYNLPLPETAIYQNRVIDIGHAKLADRFEEFVVESASLLSSNTGDITIGSTYIFDFGMHATIKKTLLSLAKDPIFVNKDDNMKFVCFILRNMIIEHTMLKDPMFKYELSQCDIRKMKEDHILTKAGNIKYYELSFIHSFLKRYKRKDLLVNQETKDLMTLVKEK